MVKKMSKKPAVSKVSKTKMSRSKPKGAMKVVAGYAKSARGKMPMKAKKMA